MTPDEFDQMAAALTKATRQAEWDHARALADVHVETVSFIDWCADLQIPDTLMTNKENE